MPAAQQAYEVAENSEAIYKEQAFASSAGLIFIRRDVKQ
jgi:hypothetical protein